jgi:hypothetical protein
MDPLVAPPRILAGKPHDQLLHLFGYQRSALGFGALRHQAWLTSQPCGRVSLSRDAAMQPQPGSVEVTDAVADPLAF